MTAPQDHDAALLREGGLAAIVIRNKENILERFCVRAQQNLGEARRQPHPVLIDTLPSFITRVALALAGSDYMEFASQYSNIALQHGNERARFTRYSLAELHKEYQFLREILVDVLLAHATPTVDEWKVVHRSLDEAMAEAATAFVEVNDDFRELFTAALTHDFRAPLSNAWNYLELMRREASAGAREQFAQRASQNLRRVGRMIAGLLDASRSNAGEPLNLEAGSCDLADLLNESLRDLDPRARHRVVLDLPAPIMTFWDREKIHRAVDNLIDNALKYSVPESSVTVRGVETHGRVHLSVHNRGDPISPEQQKEIFQPFRRAAAAQAGGKPGWGLGLVQVQAIAEAHGGGVGVESTAESGNTFTLDLIRDIRELIK